MYKVQEVIMHSTGGEETVRYHILNNDIPVFRVNDFLDTAGKNSVHTGKQYAYRLCKFFNFLMDIRGRSYKEATRNDVKKFVNAALFGTDTAFYIDKGQLTYNTISHYLSVIKEFYRFLEGEKNEAIKMHLDKVMKSSKHSYLYGQIWDMDSSVLLEKSITRTKSSREYIKWYTTDEKEALKENFLTLRDKAIFLLTLEGMRIDEVLSSRLFDYDSVAMEVTPYRSKGKETGNVGSVVVLPIETTKVIDDYIFNERDQALIKLQGKDPEMIYPQELFINLRNGHELCRPVSYKNFYGILKSVAKRAGIDPGKIRTHSGRSTKTMELLHHQVEHPEDGITDEHIRQIMRWQSPSSIEPYVNLQDKRLAIETAKKIQKHNEENVNV